MRAVETTQDVIGLFSDPGKYRARLAYIAENVGMVAHAWSQPDLPDLDGTLGILYDWSNTAVVPLGYERAQENLMGALGCYQEAMDAFRLARVTTRPCDYEVAWGHVGDGYIMLSLAIKLAEAVHDRALARKPAAFLVAANSLQYGHAHAGSQ